MLFWPRDAAQPNPTPLGAPLFVLPIPTNIGTEQFDQH